MTFKRPTRRDVLVRSALGFGSLALTSLLADDGGLVAADGSLVGRSHFQGKARSVIFLFMGGGPSQVDTFDPKPELQKLNGKAVPPSIARDIPMIARAPLTDLYGSPYSFARYGRCGLPVSELFPEIGSCVDDICVLRSCRHDSPIHAPAEYMATTGTQIGDRPSLGSWIAYGLGSENQNLPSFIVMRTGETGRPAAWSNGFLPARYQGTLCEPSGIPNLATPAEISNESRRLQLDLMEKLNSLHAKKHADNGELEARIKSYEMAFRMQSAAPEIFDLARETDESKRLYGVDREDTKEFGTLCLLARRMVERGVRFVQLRSGGWDAHGNLIKNHGPQAAKTDRPIAGLLKDLKRRGLLEQTLVIWGGEFGRTPAAENPGPTPGRNHSPSGYTMWLAGGGVRGGQAIGATDPIGYAAIEKPIHPVDLHATVLKSLGLDQHELYYLHHNRKELVTVNGGKVIDEVFA